MIINKGKIIETNVGIALVLRQDEDMPHLWHILVGKDRSLVYDTNINKARSRVGALIESHQQDQIKTFEENTEKLEEELKFMKQKLLEINDLLDDKIEKE